MRVYKVKVYYIPFGSNDTIRTTELCALTDKENIEEFIEMSYSGFGDIVQSTWEETYDLVISKELIREEAQKFIQKELS